MGKKVPYLPMYPTSFLFHHGLHYQCLYNDMERANRVDAIGVSLKVTIVLRSMLVLVYPPSGLTAVRRVLLPK
jgi:hypothetical protein